MRVGLQRRDEAIRAEGEHPANDPHPAAVLPHALPDQPGTADLEDVAATEIGCAKLTDMTLSSRIQWVLIAALAAALVAIGALSFVLIHQDDASASPKKPRLTPCDRKISVSTETNSAMRDIAARLRGDHRIQSLTTETKRQAYERFKKTFSEQPELIEMTRPESLPASVKIVPAHGIDREQLVTQLRAEFPVASKVRDPCAARESAVANCRKMLEYHTLPQ